MRRPGATLVEVLVAIFVMGIGLIALFTLFPLGALRMAQAIRDDRAALAAANGFAVCTMKSVRTDSSVRWQNDPNANSVTPANPPQYDVFLDADGPSYPTLSVGAYPPTDRQGPSYAVLVDPTGKRTAAGLSSGDNVAGLPFLPRRTTSFVNTNTDALRWFTVLDDIYFDQFGKPDTSTGNFERDIRFSYALLLQRPKSSDASITSVSVVVYQQRPLGLSGQLSLNEYAYQDQGKFDYNSGTGTLNSNKVTIDYSSGNTQPPPVRAGDWILDATVITSGSGANMVAYPHANFYRVVAVAEGTNAVELELQQPIRGFSLGSNRTIVILEGVVEVFDKGPGNYLDQ